MSSFVPSRDSLSASRKMLVVTRLAKSSRDGRAQLVAEIATELNVGERTIWRWLSRFQNSGRSGLSKRPRSDRGTSRWFARRPDVALRVWLRWADGWTLSAIHDSLWHELIDPPSLDTLRSYLRFLSAKKVQ